MSKGASREPQEIKMLFAVLPETSCQGLFVCTNNLKYLDCLCRIARNDMV